MIEKILLLATADAADTPSFVRAMALAEASGAGVELFDTVYEPLLEGYLGNARVHEMYGPLRQRLVDESKEKLEALAARVRERGIACTAEVVWSGQRHEALASRVVLDRADLVVTALSDSTHHLSHTDWKLVATCPAPLLIVRGDGKAAYRRVVAAVDPYHEHGKPAALDSAIVRQAKAFANLGGGEVRIVHCFTPIGDFVADDVGALPAEEAETALETARQHALERLVEQEDLPADSARLIAGRPETALQSLADSGEADLFVLGVASRGRIREFFIGSTTERLLRATGTLVIKPPDFKVSVTLEPSAAS
jgi:universal stress protein E